MPEQARLYDLVLVLSMTAEDDRRAKILSDLESQLTGAGGTLERHDEWNRRPMAYEIDHQAEGEYHLFQFRGPTPLLESLSHSLRIDDAVLRFRIIKVVPGTPPAPDSPPPVVAGTPAAAPAVSAAPVEIER
ncbi:MAG: 30S ribosomal protein S6 [Solirubrobacteraceae bacterium]